MGIEFLFFSLIDSGECGGELCRRTRESFVSQAFAFGEGGLVLCAGIPIYGESELQEMAVGDGERIRGVQFLGHLFVGYVQETLEHAGNLLFGRVSVAGNRHFDFHGRVLVNRHIFRQRRGYRHALRMDNLNHGLRVLVHKLRLDGEA